ncbi:molybdopterin molybdenumtransferase [Microcystis aeruginosa NIES-2520]|uniref:Molybdopterin molybdenumtransferase n=1 Tax=Microcystis aeruginosa NIES-2520 TaxID=2303982 RepID=A0A5A5RU01_MICAE|nr:MULTISPECIES: gephyrin-like molybdotransferase Glp [Microcystis]NCR76583.1 molybdopterin molybdotransferase MoeA [Microcystis aeruginosa K13-06]MCA2668183.1 molybdopterin molybdotransferase MoeA [Microcystis sp. M045S2]MCA2715043.1 molybdopterin molybdotransferase MoeA [Microcystis sp. M172S2]MCA2802799.1 molybdopterin molybdotransferase MoeA [Microcystis sp. M114S2]MCA2833568.1 molybdopterin molybdotransferase MoeA [Microcystis sp. M007S1]
MYSVKEAESIILTQIQPRQETEKVSLEAAFGRILAEDISSDLDFPYWDNSAMDGYAVRYEDVKDTNPENPVTLKIIAEIPAGKVPEKIIQPGETARIFTGAMLPAGSDTIIMQENTQKKGERVAILIPPEKIGLFVRQRGTFYRAGNTLLKAGIALNSPEMAVLATAQATELTVFSRPQVAIFSTGDELINPDETLQKGQIIDSNRYALTAFVASLGAIPRPLGIIKDNPDLLRETIRKAINSSAIVLSTGGVSVGDYDYIEGILGELGGKILIGSVAIQPGKPLTFATFPNGCIYFGIPGNPVSALVSCWRFVQMAIKKLSGLTDYQNKFLRVVTRDTLQSKGQREVYLWGKIEIIEGVYQFQLAPGQHNSANLINLAGTNALAIITQGKTTIQAGETVEVMIVS